VFKLNVQIRLHNEYWAVAHTCEELGRYYRAGFNWYNRFNGIRVGDMRWGPHISFIRGEEPTDFFEWNALHEKEIEVEIEPIYRTNGKHLWFNILSEQIFDLREKVGLKRYRYTHPPFNGLHLTLGTYHRKDENDNTQLVIPDSLIEDDWLPLARELRELDD
jgi:hypothetical protein